MLSANPEVESDPSLAKTQSKSWGMTPGLIEDTTKITALGA